MLEGINEMVNSMKLKWENIKADLKNQEFEEAVGGGNLKIKINGEQIIKDVKINPEFIKTQGTDIQLLEDLIKTGVNKAVKRSKEEEQKKMKELTGGLNIPSGLNGLF